MNEGEDVGFPVWARPSPSEHLVRYLRVAWGRVVRALENGIVDFLRGDVREREVIHVPGGEVRVEIMF